MGLDVHVRHGVVPCFIFLVLVGEGSNSKYFISFTCSSSKLAGPFLTQAQRGVEMKLTFITVWCGSRFYILDVRLWPVRAMVVGWHRLDTR